MNFVFKRYTANFKAAIFEFRHKNAGHPVSVWAIDLAEIPRKIAALERIGGDANGKQIIELRRALTGLDALLAEELSNG